MKLELLKETQKKLSQISPSLCLSKWYKSTILLQSGETHSCYHPRAHIIPVTELEKNPSSLHNTLQKKQARCLMLAGERIPECQYCWDLENTGEPFASDRIISSYYINKCIPHWIDTIKKDSWDIDVNPIQLEISFNNLCNFKCCYCHPRASSCWWDEIKKHGSYQGVQSHHLRIDGITTYPDKNPYIEAFWRWWPSLKLDLKSLRITGGEPLLHSETWKLLDSILNHPLPDLNLSINSNFGVKTPIINKLSDYVNKLRKAHAIKSFSIITSLDTWGKPAEYIRTGLKLVEWENNVSTYIKATNSPIELMITFSLLSVASFGEFLNKMLDMKRIYKSRIVPSPITGNRVGLWINRLTSPILFDVSLLPQKEFLPYMYRHLNFMEMNIDDSSGFSPLEVEKFRSLINCMTNPLYADNIIQDGRRDFAIWIKERDRRIGTNFFSAFPEYDSFYKLCCTETRGLNA